MIEVFCQISCLFRAEAPYPTADSSTAAAAARRVVLVVCLLAIWKSELFAPFIFNFQFSIFIFLLLFTFFVFFHSPAGSPIPEWIWTRGVSTPQFLSTKLVLGPTSTDALPLLLVCCPCIQLHVCVSFASPVHCPSALVPFQKAMSTTEVPSTLPGNVPLSEHDPALYDLIEKEKVRG